MKLFYKQLGACLLFVCAMFTGEVAYGQNFAANLTIEGVFCPGDSFQVEVTGINGTPPYRVSRLLTPTDDPSYNPFNPDTVDRQPAPFITYQQPDTIHYYYVTDSNNPPNEFAVAAAPNLSNLLQMQALAPPISCAGGLTNVTVQAIGGIPPYTGTGMFPVTAGTHSFTVIDDEGCEVSQTITVNDGPICNNVCNDSLKIDSCFCGETLPAINSEFSVQSGKVTPGADYRFRVVNVGLGIDAIISSIASQPGGDFSQLNNRRKTSLAFLDPCDMQYNTTYTVYVSAFVNGVWTDFDDSCPCDITTPAAPAPRLSTQYCEGTVPSMSTPLVVKDSSRVLGARAYRYCFIDTANDDTIMVVKDGHRPWITSFYQASGIDTSTTYCIYVKAEICVGGMWVWTASGDPCYVTSPSSLDRRYQSGGNSTIGEQSNSLTPGFQFDVKNHETTMTLYPNPGKGSETLLSLENLGKNSTVNVTVVDFQGKQVYNKSFRSSGNSFTTPVQFNQQLTPGTYFIHVNAGETRINQKLIIR